MEFFLKYLAGPLIGAVIGYFTNYIAVKMLFFPREEKKLFGKTLPFTPGAIPKGKPRLAKAVGNVVGKTLVTKEDIEEKIVSSDLGDQIGEIVTKELAHSVKELALDVGKLPEEKYQQGKEKIADILSNQIVTALSEVDLASFIATKGGAILKEKVQGTMLQMFVNDALIESITTPIGAELQKLVTEQGNDYIRPMIIKKMEEKENQGIMEMVSSMNMDEAAIKEIISSIFMKAVKPGISKLMDSIDLATIAEDKINQMSNQELEGLVLTVMKKELNMIVNLGALIGFVLGLLNIII